MIIEICNNKKKKREKEKRKGRREKKKRRKKKAHVRIFLLRERKDYRRGAVTMFDSHKRLGD